MSLRMSSEVSGTFGPQITHARPAVPSPNHQNNGSPTMNAALWQSVRRMDDTQRVSRTVCQICSTRRSRHQESHSESFAEQLQIVKRAR